MLRRALSPREHTCLHWAALGKPSREISQLLGIRERTVNFHLQNACHKLSARNRRAAVVTALSLGLLDLDQPCTKARARPAKTAYAEGLTSDDAVDAGSIIRGASAATAQTFALPPAAACPRAHSPPPR
ncbi:helix-turn-helix transcriptional regulator [Bordetella sp. N]|uniref:helix-turn-helix domain-containing protein n=1 Tax=Bordetella sp. N TaxID=1746199 RepID=UPI0009EB7119|nr:helix-turn-helix transcriptional regulator [Bordetella sp. N]